MHPMNTSYMYIHHYLCHGNHHFPTETIYGESSYEGSVCNRMLSESDPMLNLFTRLILTHIIWAVKISLLLVLRILRERMESLDVFPHLFLFIFATRLCDPLIGVWASGHWVDLKGSSPKEPIKWMEHLVPSTPALVTNVSSFSHAVPSLLKGLWWCPS